MQLEEPRSAETRRSAPTPERRLRQELRQAAHTKGFALAYQPRTNLGHGERVGAALQLRWPRRRGGTTQGSFFWPMLEQFGLADEVAGWALCRACTAAATWPRGLLCVTADKAALRQGLLLRQVGAALSASRLPADRLEIGIAEPALATDSEETLFTLASLRDLGVHIALAGFGSDSASLLPLRRLPLTTLKLDRSLVRDLPEDRDAAAIVRAATDFAHSQGVTVVACGVETQPQATWLRDNGCDEAQGAQAGRIVTAQEMSALL